MCDNKLFCQKSKKNKKIYCQECSQFIYENNYNIIKTTKKSYYLHNFCLDKYLIFSNLENNNYKIENNVITEYIDVVNKKKNFFNLEYVKKYYKKIIYQEALNKFKQYLVIENILTISDENYWHENYYFIQPQLFKKYMKIKQKFNYKGITFSENSKLFKLGISDSYY